MIPNISKYYENKVQAEGRVSSDKDNTTHF